MNDLAKDYATEAKAALFLKSLREDTSAAHSLLESNLLLSTIISPDVSRRHYYFYLILMKEVEEKYKKDIMPLLTALFSKDQRKASLLITDDLHSLGYIPPENIELKPYDISLENISIPFALGFMYVMKGSQLGGRVIFKHLQRVLGLSEYNGASFISGYGISTMADWKTFLSVFSHYIVENDGAAAAIKGAQFAFSSVLDFFEKNRPLYEI